MSIYSPCSRVSCTLTSSLPSSLMTSFVVCLMRIFESIWSRRGSTSWLSTSLCSSFCSYCWQTVLCSLSRNSPISSYPFLTLLSQWPSSLTTASTHSNSPLLVSCFLQEKTNIEVELNKLWHRNEQGRHLTLLLGNNEVSWKVLSPCLLTCASSLAHVFSRLWCSVSTCLVCRSTTKN